jgi:hypothetical protein
LEAGWGLGGGLLGPPQAACFLRAVTLKRSVTGAGSGVHRTRALWGCVALGMLGKGGPEAAGPTLVSHDREVPATLWGSHCSALPA